LTRGWGADHGERASLNGGLGAEAPADLGSEPLVSPWWGVKGALCPLKLEAFFTFLYKKWPNVKDFSENLPPVFESRHHHQP